jgi:hypothetical protein
MNFQTLDSSSHLVHARASSSPSNDSCADNSTTTTIMGRAEIWQVNRPPQRFRWRLGLASTASSGRGELGFGAQARSTQNHESASAVACGGSSMRTCSDPWPTGPSDLLLGGHGGDPRVALAPASSHDLRHQVSSTSRPRRPIRLVGSARGRSGGG